MTCEGEVVSEAVLARETVRLRKRCQLAKAELRRLAIESGLSTTVDGDRFPREFDGVVGTESAVSFRGNLTGSSAAGSTARRVGNIRQRVWRCGEPGEAAVEQARGAG
jgi:hypothetical protein